MRTLRKILCLFVSCLFLFPITTGFAKEEAVEVAIVGDIMALSAQIRSAYTKDKGYDFRYAFKYVAPILKSADLCIGNLETPVAGKSFGYTAGRSKNGYPWLNAPDSFLDAVKEAGFDVLGTANNHCLDCGVKGAFNTLNAIQKRDMLSAGTYKTKEAKNTPLITRVKGVSIAVLSYTQSTNSREGRIGKDEKYVFNKLSVPVIQKEIARAKEAGADVVIVLAHWGSEGSLRSNGGQKSTAKAIAKAGADIIIGSHPHVLQETAVLNSQTPYGKKKCFVAYSLGNFVSSMCGSGNKDSAILKFNITKYEAGNVIIEPPHCIATYTTAFKQKRFVVLPYFNVEEFTSSKAVLGSLRSSYARTAKRLNTKYVKMQK